jgi:transcriptional regulator with XRE-family HTH domain
MINEFSEIFKMLRKEKHLTQEQIAEILGVSPQAISRWENSATFPDVTLLPQIAGYFDTTVDELLGITKVCKMQKLLCVQGMWQESFDKVNEYLADGWSVKDIQTHSIGEGNNIQGTVLIEKQIYQRNTDGKDLK